MVFILAAAMVGCAGSKGGTDSNSDARLSSQSEGNSEEEKTSTDTSDSNEESKAEDSVENGKILVAYFSHSGNTKKIAEEIQSKTGADIFEIKTVNAYSDDYNTVLDEAKAELNDKARPELGEKVEDMAQYQTVIIGYPIWWGQAPKIMYTFIEHYNLSGKTVVPFCTSASSGIGTSATNLQTSDTSQAVWLAGRRFSGNSPKSDVVNWLVGLGLQ